MALFGCASDEQFMDELSEDIFERHTGVSYQDYLQGVTEDPYREDKCDHCNCALRDCSLCGSGVDG